MSRILMYLSLLNYGHEKARHHAFHTCNETWELIDFKPGDDWGFWSSDHSVTCNKCGIKYEAYRSHLNKAKFGELGSTFEEARARAEAMTQQDN